MGASHFRTWVSSICVLVFLYLCGAFLRPRTYKLCRQIVVRVKGVGELFHSLWCVLRAKPRATPLSFQHLLVRCATGGPQPRSSPAWAWVSSRAEFLEASQSREEASCFIAPENGPLLCSPGSPAHPTPLLTWGQVLEQRWELKEVPGKRSLHPLP